MAGFLAERKRTSRASNRAPSCIRKRGFICLIGPKKRAVIRMI
jgi:hypothetical protein